MNAVVVRNNFERNVAKLGDYDFALFEVCPEKTSVFFGSRPAEDILEKLRWDLSQELGPTPGLLHQFWPENKVCFPLPAAQLMLLLRDRIPRLEIIGGPPKGKTGSQLLLPLCHECRAGCALACA